MSWGDEALARIGRGPARDRCVTVVRTFALGHRLAIEARGPPRLDLPRGLRGFAVEGVACALSDAGWVTDPADRPFAEIGLGWSRAIGRHPVADAPWVADGHGFCDALLRTGRVVDRQARLGTDHWDRGVGRALWFVAAGDARRLARLVGTFPADRRAALWTGVGIASAWTGGVDTDERDLLVALSSTHQGHLAAGVALAGSLG